jgi:hypothetical protein
MDMAGPFELPSIERQLDDPFAGTLICLFCDKYSLVEDDKII